MDTHEQAEDHDCYEEVEEKGELDDQREPAASTRLPHETPFSKEKKPIAWETTSSRTMTSRKRDAG